MTNKFNEEGKYANAMVKSVYCPKRDAKKQRIVYSLNKAVQRTGNLINQRIRRHL